MESSEGDGGENSNDDGEEDSQKAIDVPFAHGKDSCDRDGGRSRVFGSRVLTDSDRCEEVRGKKEQGSGVRNSYSLFVDNIPPNTSREGIREIFGRFGRISSIFLSRKRRKGSRNWFGFVRFLNKQDAEEARGSVDGMRFGDLVLSVNIPRFDRKSRWFSRRPMTETGMVDGMGSEGGSSSKMGMRSRACDEGEAKLLPCPLQVGCSSSDGLGGTGGRDSGFGIGKLISHAQRVSGTCGSASWAKNVQGTHVSSSGVINRYIGNPKSDNIGHTETNLPGGKSRQDDSKSGCRKRILGTIKVSDWDRCAAIAQLRDGKLFYDMRSIILETCSYVRTISLIKDNYVLIMFQSSNHCVLAIEHGFWSHWFYYIKAWNDGKAEDVNRLWVECRGIPFCAWNEVTFNAIASVWGSIVEVDPDTLDMVHLSSARFCIATYASAIEDIFDLQVGDNSVVVSVSSSIAQSMSSAPKRPSMSPGQQQAFSPLRLGMAVFGQPINPAISETKESPPRALVDHSTAKGVQDEHCPFSVISKPVSVLDGEDTLGSAQGAGFIYEASGDVARAVPSGTVVHAQIQGSGLSMQGMVRPISGISTLLSAQSGVISNGPAQRDDYKFEDSGAASMAVSGVVNKVQAQLQGLGSLPEDFGGKVSALEEVDTVQDEAAVRLICDSKQRLAEEADVSHMISRDVDKVPVLLREATEIDSDEGDHHGIAGNLVPVATLIKEYNKDLVIPAKFLSMPGSINISKAGFYAVCNRLIEVIDEILDMSSYLGFPCSIEAQRGIKEVMTGRQTRALGMIMDSV